MVKLSVKSPHLLSLMSISADVMAAGPSDGDASSDRSTTNALTFEEVYAQGFPHVVRWIRAFGGFDADLEDLAQEIFVVVRRQLPKFDGKNLAGWLYRITQRTVRDYREGAWFRRAWADRHRDKRAEPSPSGIALRLGHALGIDDYIPCERVRVLRNSAVHERSACRGWLTDEQSTIWPD